MAARKRRSSRQKVSLSISLRTARLPTRIDFIMFSGIHAGLPTILPPDGIKAAAGPGGQKKPFGYCHNGREIQRGRWVMEAIILILIIGSFAWWCFSQGSKPRETSELEKRKEVAAWSEDMHRRYKDVELPAGWSKSITPSVKSTARGQASRPLSNPAPTSTRPGPSPTAAPSATNLSSPLSPASVVPKKP
jgi:hypothetical protein